MGVLARRAELPPPAPIFYVSMRVLPRDSVLHALSCPVLCSRRVCESGTVFCRCSAVCEHYAAQRRRGKETGTEQSREEKREGRGRGGFVFGAPGRAERGERSRDVGHRHRDQHQEAGGATALRGRHQAAEGIPGSNGPEAVLSAECATGSITDRNTSQHQSLPAFQALLDTLTANGIPLSLGFLALQWKLNSPLVNVLHNNEDVYTNLDSQWP